MALIEAIAHLNKGMDLIAALSRSAERDGRELDLRTLSGTAWMALKGWAAQEVWDSLFPALELANSLRRDAALLPILWGLVIHVVCRGRVAESLRWVSQLMNAAETYRDPDLPIAAPICAISFSGAKRSSRAISESRKVSGIARLPSRPAYSQ